MRSSGSAKSTVWPGWRFSVRQSPATSTPTAATSTSWLRWRVFHLRRAFFETRECLEHAPGREVQLVSRKSLRNPYYIHAIETTEVTLFPADEFARIQHSEYLPRNREDRFPREAPNFCGTSRTHARPFLVRRRECHSKISLRSRCRGCSDGAANQSCGYATERLREHDPETAAGLPGINAVIAARENVLYEYDKIDYRNLWETVRMVMPG